MPKNTLIRCAYTDYFSGVLSVIYLIVWYAYHVPGSVMMEMVP